MNRFRKILNVLVVMAMLLMGLAPAIGAQAPEGASDGRQFAPPRPDLMAQLQMASRNRPGFALDAKLGAEQAEAQFNQYLAGKVDPSAAAPSSVALQAAPANNKIVVALAEYADLAHNQIPKPRPENNTDWHVDDFSYSYYDWLLFDTSPNNFSLANYYREASSNVIPPYLLTGAVHNWTAVTGGAAQYGNDLGTGVDNNLADGRDVYRLVRDAADTLATWGPPGGTGWAPYGHDEGGRTVLDYFFVVHAGRGQEYGGGALGDNSIWSTNGSLTATYWISADLGVRNFVVLAEDAPVGVWVHEMGHLLGLPDTWNPSLNPDSTPVDKKNDIPWPKRDAGRVGEPSPSFYDPMGDGMWLGMPLGSRPASMTSWERIQLGFLSPKVWRLTDFPASSYLTEIEWLQPADKALKIELPAAYAHSGQYVQRAPAPAFPCSPTSMLTRTVFVPASGTISFRFWQWRAMLPGTQTGYVEINGSTVFTVTGNSGGWEQRSVDLSGYHGAYVDIRFRLEQSACALTPGWLLDDFELLQNSTLLWSDDGEVSDLGPSQSISSPGLTWQPRRQFPRFKAEHYYLAEWRNDDTNLAGFDAGLKEAYNMTDLASGHAEYFRYNPGLLIWYYNSFYLPGDNNVDSASGHPGAGFLLPVDAHTVPITQSTNIPWRTRVQMQDATFREAAPTYLNQLHDSANALRFIGNLPAVRRFYDAHSLNPYYQYPYWDPGKPENSVKTPQYGISLYVERENPDKTGALIAFSIDVGPITSTKIVDKPVAAPGEVLAYTVVVTNNGIADAHTVVITDNAPVHSTYMMGSALVQGSPSYVLNETAAGWVFTGTVPLAHPITITFQATLDPAIANASVVRNTAYVYEGTHLEAWPYADTLIRSTPCLLPSEKTGDPRVVRAGDIVTYTIALGNSGNADAPNAMITDCIPTGPYCNATYVPGSLTYTAGQGYYDPQSNCIYWTGPVTATPLVGTAVTFITFAVEAQPSRDNPCAYIRNVVRINDRVNPEIERSVETSVSSAPNLRKSTKSVSKSLAAPGDRLDYTIVITNNGNLNASVGLTDAIPGNTTYIPGSLSYTSSSGSYNGGLDQIDWSGTIVPGEMATVRFGVTITNPLADWTTLTNTADIYEYSTATNYPRTVTTTVRSGPDLSTSEKTVTATSAGYGGILTYTITLRNTGTEDAPAVYVTDSIPSGTFYRSGSLSWTPGAGRSGSYDGANDRILWNGPMAVGDVVTISFEVSITIQGTGIISNSAYINDGEHTVVTTTATTWVAAIEVVNPTQSILCGDLVTVPIRISNVGDLQGFQISLGYDETILQMLSIQEGTWFAPALWTIKTFSNVDGTSTVAASLLNTNPGLTGGGVLYTLNFRAVGSGTSPITFTYTLLSNTPAPNFTPIPHNTVNGSVTVGARSISGRAYLQGRPLNDQDGGQVMYGSQVLDVTDVNGDYSFCPPVGAGESFTLRITKQGYLYASKPITVGSGGTQTVTLVTLLGGDVIGSQTTVGSPLTCTTPVTLTIAGPMDAKVNVLDLTFVGARFGKTPTAADWGIDVCHPDWVSYKADINEDNPNPVVNIFDLVLVGNNFGRTAPVPWP